MSRFGFDMTQQVMVFTEDSNLTFDDFAKQNGIVYWLASDLAAMLGYKDMNAINKAINKASGVCATLNIPFYENFIQQSSQNTQHDFKLTRFACYLTVMNGDINNSTVAMAQAYFAKLADEIETACQNHDGVSRVYNRGEITAQEKSLSGVARAHGVTDYALFQNAGYRGMYNMNISKLKNKKGLQNTKDTLLDYMNSTELAANIFRISQTEEKIKNQNITGQVPLENAAETVGRTVRNVMIQNMNVSPENIPLDREKISVIKSDIKKTKKALDKHDSKNKK